MARCTDFRAVTGPGASSMLKNPVNILRAIVFTAATLAVILTAGL